MNLVMNKKKQMYMILIFVDKDGFIEERLFGLAPVNDTTSLTLKQKVCEILSLHNLMSLKFVINDMMVLVIWKKNETFYNHYLWSIVLMHIIFIVLQNKEES